MGLDFAHFLLNVDEEFNVDLFAHDFSKISTLEDFITLLEEETAKSPHTQVEADHLFQEKFLVIQNFFAEELAIDPSHLTPETQVAPLLHSLSRRRIWKKLREEISPNIPPLRWTLLFSTIPKDCNSLNGITRCIVRKISLDSESKVWTRETITEAVLRIASEQTGIPREKISLTENVGKVFG